MNLTSENVETITRACLFREGETTDGAMEAHGIVSRFAFHPGRIAENRQAIADMLAELPDEFQAAKGGGWSFLNACMTKGGEQWTGLHRTMEALVCLGIAAGEAQWVMPRDMWPFMPGGMPYFSVGNQKTQGDDASHQ